MKRLDIIALAILVIVVLFIVVGSVIVMDCLTYGGLYKTDFWQWLRQLWL